MNAACYEYHLQHHGYDTNQRAWRVIGWKRPLNVLCSSCRTESNHRDFNNVKTTFAVAVLSSHLQDNVHAVFESILDIDQFALRVKEDHVHDLPQILLAIPEEKIKRMQRRLARIWHRCGTVVTVLINCFVTAVTVLISSNVDR